MAKLHRDEISPSRSAQIRAQNEGMDQAARALSYLISGVLIWGGLGWLADHFLHTRFCTPIGIVIGAGLGCYLIIARFGRGAQQGSATTLDQSTETSDTSETKS